MLVKMAQLNYLCSAHPSLSAAAAKLLQSCPTLCNPIDGSPLGSSVSGILQARILGWVGVSCIPSPCMKVKSESEVAQSCPTLSDPMDCSPPGSSVHGIFQARVLEGVATAYLKRSGELPLREEHPHRGDDI